MPNERRFLIKQRRRMWQDDPRCRECGIETILPEDLIKITGRPLGQATRCEPKLRDRMATIDHHRSRLDPDRHKGGPHRLLCWKCNSARNDKEQQESPREVLWKKCGAYPAEVRYTRD